MLGWAWPGMADVLGRFGTFGDVWGLLGMFGDVWGHLETFGDIWGHLGRKPIYCITIFKQVSTCSKDDAIIPRGNGLGWP